MATQWYFQLNGKEAGPVTFRDLVERVRAGAMLETDLVRPSWIGDWQRADSVVGLFYMAGRSAEELSPLDPAPMAAAGTPSFELPLSDAAAPAEAGQRPGWMTRLWSVATFRGLRGEANRDHSSDSALGASLRPNVATPAERTAPPVAWCGPAQKTGGLKDDSPTANAPSVTETPAAERAPARLSLADTRHEDWSQTVNSALAAVDARRSALRDAARPSRISRWFGRSDETSSVSGPSHASWSGRVAAWFRWLFVDSVSALIESVLVVATRLWSILVARIVVSLCGAAALIVAGYACIPAHWLVSNEEAIQTLDEIWSGVQELREEGADPAEWEAFAKTSHERLAKLALALEKTASSSQAARELLFATRDCLPKLLVPLGDEPTAEVERQFSLYMSRAKKSLLATANNDGIDSRWIGIMAVIDVGIVALLLRAARTRWFAVR